MRSDFVGTIVVAVALVLAPATWAGLVSKSYEFKRDILLEVGAATEDGLRVDAVRFHIPPTVDGRTTRTAGLANATVSISNTGDSARKFGLVLALFDAEGRLLGVASVGTSLRPLRGGRQRTYTLVFEHVNSMIHRATTFQISLESRP